MPDREKVIKGLGDISAYFRSTLDAMIGGTLACELFRVYAETAESAIALLKAQEPVMVEERADTNTINCPKCGQQFARIGRDKSIYLDTDEEPNYCPKCGQAVKWE